jgi:protoheme IX farnesyltransferase
VQPQVQPAGPAVALRRPTLLADLVSLTKPRVISLLLLTPIAPMYATGRGAPPPTVVCVVLLAGYLMAGGANAINMWFDRDIDDKMSRTRLRPIPAGRLAAPVALVFGIGLAAIAFGLFWQLVNPLSAWLALGGLLFYVFVYTIWLKRSSPQNIVIGGAAGAFPPLVGWAAATGSLDLAAVYLFAIIFYWTPPHFWALALIKRAEYARAGVPMLPVVRGERETTRQIIIYSLVLVGVTLLPVAWRTFGFVYLASAIVLGTWFLLLAWRLRAEPTPARASGLFHYSLAYLALLFVAMAVDPLLT